MLQGKFNMETQMDIMCVCVCVCFKEIQVECEQNMMKTWQNGLRIDEMKLPRQYPRVKMDKSISFFCEKAKYYDVNTCESWHRNMIKFA